MPTDVTKSNSHIELAAQSPAGQMIRNRFVDVGNGGALQQWRNTHKSSNIYTSIAKFSEPNREGEYVCDFFLDIDAPKPATALQEALLAGEVLYQHLQIDPASIAFFFSGTGTHLVIDRLVFGNPDTSETMRVWHALAKRLASAGVHHADLGIYQPARLWRLPNSLNTKSNLYKIPLEHAELKVMSSAEILELARQPREWDDMAEPNEAPKAVGWFDTAVSHLAKLRPRPSTSRNHLTRGWRRPPCIERIESDVLPDGVRHHAYFALSRFYASAGASPEEIEQRLFQIDRRNPISDTNYIQRTAENACRYRFNRCPASGIHRFCEVNQCHLASESRRGGDRNQFSS